VRDEEDEGEERARRGRGEGEDAHVAAVLLNIRVEREARRLTRAVCCCDPLDEPCASESVVQARVVVQAERVEVGAARRQRQRPVRQREEREEEMDAPQCAGEEERLLRDDREALAQLLEPNLGDVVPVDLDGAVRQLEDAEQGLRDGRLACGRARDEDSAE